jgi:predicted xylose isomerase-like sugar epimerase
MTKKLISFEKFCNLPKVYECSEVELQSDYKKLEIREQYSKLMKKLKSNLNKKEIDIDIVNSVQEEIDKLIRIKK